MILDPVLAHQGGWDEVIVLLSPVVVFVGLRLLERRRRRRPGGTAGSPSATSAEPPADA